MGRAAWVRCEVGVCAGCDLCELWGDGAWRPWEEWAVWAGAEDGVSRSDRLIPEA